MINFWPSPELITEKTIELFYNHIITEKDLADYACAELNNHDFENSINRNDLIDMIDIDLSDMLHNGNFDFYLTLEEYDSLSDDEMESLSDWLLDNIDAEMIADKLMTKLMAI